MTDPRALVERKFAGPPEWPGFDLLTRCATDPPLAIGTLLEAVRPERPRARICELGFGSGWLLEEMTRAYPDAVIYGLDQSASYVAHAHTLLPDVRILRGDMEALPFAEATFDVIVTCWTLYFMRDIDAALAGMKRCLRPGGRFVAATVAPDHMHEHDEMLDQAVREALAREPARDIGDRFDLASGDAPVRRAFDRVELREWRGVLTIASVDDAIQLFASYAPDGIDGHELEAVRAAYRRLAKVRLAEGPLPVTRHDGAFVAIP